MYTKAVLNLRLTLKRYLKKKKLFDLMIILNAFPLNRIFSITIGGTELCVS